MKDIIRFGIMFTLSALLIQAAPAAGDELYFFDAHSQVDHEVIVYPDDKRVQAALKYAIESNRPFVVHIEFAALHGEKRKKFMEAFKGMLDRHPDQPFLTEAAKKYTYT